MKLYHGTSALYLESILDQGIQPRLTRPSNWEKCPSREDVVYLTNAYGFFYAAEAAKESAMLIVEVDVDLDDLLPDEDWLEQVSRKPDDLPRDMLARTWAYRDALDQYGEYAIDSLAGLGNAAHLGPISKDQITGMAVISDDAFSFAFDPTICLANYSIMGEYYRNGMRWLFDPDSELEAGGLFADRNAFIKELPRTHVKLISALS